MGGNPLGYFINQQDQLDSIFTGVVVWDSPNILNSYKMKTTEIAIFLALKTKAKHIIQQPPGDDLHVGTDLQTYTYEVS